MFGNRQFSFLSYRPPTSLSNKTGPAHDAHDSIMAFVGVADAVAAAAVAATAVATVPATASAASAAVGFAHRHVHSCSDKLFIVIWTLHGTAPADLLMMMMMMLLLSVMVDGLPLPHRCRRRRPLVRAFGEKGQAQDVFDRVADPHLVEYISTVHEEGDLKEEEEEKDKEQWSRGEEGDDVPCLGACVSRASRLSGHGELFYLLGQGPAGRARERGNRNTKPKEPEVLLQGTFVSGFRCLACDLGLVLCLHRDMNHFLFHSLPRMETPFLYIRFNAHPRLAQISGLPD